jgi:23S rRNA pseudouridine2605 synthase
MALERLQKILSRSGVASRRKAEEFIRAGRVTVNGETVSLGDRADVDQDAIQVDGKALPRPAQPLYLLLNKPPGCITTRYDEQGRPTVFDLIPPKMRKGLLAVGRLDFNTEGLLIMTTDGDFAQRVAHPSYGCLKTYEVKVKGRPSDSALGRLKGGMVIDGHRLSGASVSPLTVRGARDARRSSWWTIKLGEGRTRQVREMFFRVGNPVQRLRRVSIGGVSDPQLPKGAFRKLDQREIAMLATRRPRKKKER